MNISILIKIFQFAIKEIERFSPFVYFYDGYEEFKKQIQKLKNVQNVKYNNAEREAFLKENSWKCRVDVIIKALNQKGNIRK